MSRNITIVVIILIIVLLSFYLVWLRNKFGVISPAETPGEVLVSPSPIASMSPSPTASASPSASPKSASPSAKPK